MIVWISLIGGIILGWLIEWLIDWLYWRRGVEVFYRTEQELRRELEAAQASALESQAEAAALRSKLLELGGAQTEDPSTSASAVQPLPSNS